MTAPLTPPESDLQDFPFMPLHVARLRDSDLASEESAEACWYAVLLWAASWHQLPAGSLPDNDIVLTKLVGLGKDVRTFRKHKAGALRGFILCDDGRLYHPVVAEQVIDGWNSKLQQRWRTECARIKKQNERNKTDLPKPTFEEFMSLHYGRPSPQVVPEDTEKCPQGQSLQETGTGTGTSNSEANASGAADGGPALDIEADTWRRAKALLAERGGLTPAAAGKFFAGLLSRHGITARDLATAVTAAAVNGTHEPQSYLAKAAANVQVRRSGAPPKRVGFV